MKSWLAAFVLMTAMSMSVAAQDSTMASQSEETHGSTMAQQGDASMAQPAKAGSAPASGSALASTHKGYSSEGYGGRAEVFITGFGLFGSQANGNAISEGQTDAGGLALGYRFHLNSTSALEGRYGFSRNSDKYTIGGAVSSIPSYFSEISGSYVYTFAKPQHIRPFLEAGGGAVIFIPGNYATPRVLRTSELPPAIPAAFFLVTLSQALNPELWLGRFTRAPPRVLGHRPEECFSTAAVSIFRSPPISLSELSSVVWDTKRRISS